MSENRLRRSQTFFLFKFMCYDINTGRRLTFVMEADLDRQAGKIREGIKGRTIVTWDLIETGKKGPCIMAV